MTSRDVVTCHEYSWLDLIVILHILWLPCVITKFPLAIIVEMEIDCFEHDNNINTGQDVFH
jgi:hypothetical protein